LFQQVCSAGFRFHLQADFDLTANRQQLHHSSAWNLWLRDQFPLVFLDAFLALSLGGRLSSLLPRPEDVREPFWIEAVDLLLALLRDKPCLETEQGRICSPKQVFMRSPEIDDRLLSSDDLYSLTEMHFVAPKAAWLAKLLRCQLYGPHQLVRNLVSSCVAALHDSTSLSAGTIPLLPCRETCELVFAPLRRTGGRSALDAISAL
jgi:hypothetical protein